LHNKLFNASHVYHLCSKNTITSTHEHTRMKSKQHFPCIYRSKVVYDFIKVTWAFVVSSFFILIKARSHNIPWLIVDNEARRYSTKEPVSVYRKIVLAIHITAIVSIICRAIPRMSGLLQQAIILSWTTWNYFKLAFRNLQFPPFICLPFMQGRI